MLVGDSSVVCIGVADVQLLLNRYPGRSKDSIGYHSRDGHLYYNDKDTGNTVGKRFGKGQYSCFFRKVYIFTLPKITFVATIVMKLFCVVKCFVCRRCCY